MKNFKVYSSLSILSIVTVMEMKLVYSVARADEREMERHTESHKETVF
jgi:hypothetical protein